MSDPWCSKDLSATWDGVDFSPCFRQRFLNGVVPLAFLATSALAIASILFYTAWDSRQGLHTTPDLYQTTVSAAEKHEILAAAAAVECASLGAVVSAEARATKAKYDVIVVLGSACLFILAVARLVVNIETRSDGADWLAISVTAWAWTFALALCRLSTALSAKANVDFFIMPWLLVSVITSFVDLRSTIISESNPAVIYLDWATSVVVLLVTSAVLVAPRPWRPVPTTPGIHPPLELNSSLLSITTFSYLQPLLYNMAFPAKGDLAYSLATVPDVLPSEKAATNVRSYRQGLTTLNASREQQGKSPWGLVVSLLWFDRWMILQGEFWAFVRVATVAMPAMGLKLLLEHLGKRARGEDAPTHVALLLVFAITGAQLVMAVAGAQSMTILAKISLRTRAVLISEIFAKALRRSGAGGTTTAGGADITNIIGSDVDEVAPAIARLHFLFPDISLTIVICMYFLFRIIGVASLAGVATLLLLIPVQTLAGNAFQGYYQRLRKASDVRLAHIAEIISAVRLVKFEAWEQKLGVKMDVLRNGELQQLWAKSMTSVFDNLLSTGAPVLVSVTTFVCHTKLLHRELDAASAFSALTLFQALATPLNQFVGVSLDGIGALVSARRIQDFLTEPDTSKYHLLGSPRTPEDPIVGFRNASFSWVDAVKVESDTEAFRLRNLNLSFPLGKLSLIVGRVGSGKSTLLSALLGETTCLAGTTFLPSPITHPDHSLPGILTETVSYCSQTPWLLSDTIQGNILFGSALDEERYCQVLDACALWQDLKILELGDLTEVGERGIVLSGGQKARISLARAVYSSAKYLLLDDCLSAVDMHTAARLIETCFRGPLLAGRTVILVTHALDLALPAASFVVRIENGFVFSAGPPATVNRTDLVDEPEGRGAEANGSDDISDQDLEEKNVRMAKLKLVTEETQSRGSVSTSIYLFYVQALGGWWLALFALSFFVAAQIAEIGTSFALRSWASSYDHHNDMRISSGLFSSPLISDQTDFWLRVYCAMSLLELFLYGARVGFYLQRSVVASKSIYARLTTSLLGATVRFYDSTPTGRILNRLSSDTNTVDSRIANGQMDFMFEFFGVIGALVTITVVFPLFLIPAVLIAALYVSIASIFLTSSQEFQRSQSVARSPIFSLFGECLHGVVTLRAYAATLRFLPVVFGLLDNSTRATSASNLANRWLSIRCDIAGTAVSLATALFVVFSKRMDGALAGFVLTFALAFSEKILYTVRFWAMSAVDLNALERVKEYIEIPQETQGGVDPPAIWPSRDGILEVQDLAVRYTADLPLVLRGVSFKVLPKEKIGIVGRTGSGKSTLGLSFFRFIEASGGRIVIDGIDIRTLRLASLRSRLIIVPQEAILLSGTLRSNLDPFESYSDAELWEVLRRVHLAAAPEDATESGVSTTAGADARFVVTSLDMEVTLGGKNFSAGERQLVAIARGVLKLQSSSILILDESTASLDHATDRKIQQTLREVVPDATVLCIAHRLRTIIDYTKVLMMDEGKVVEFDAPWKLLEQEDSAFSALCRSSGEYETLREMAFAARDAAAL